MSIVTSSYGIDKENEANAKIMSFREGQSEPWDIEIIQNSS